MKTGRPPVGRTDPDRAGPVGPPPVEEGHAPREEVKPQPDA
jgi:hypothetical protein